MGLRNLEKKEKANTSPGQNARGSGPVQGLLESGLAGGESPGKEAVGKEHQQTDGRKTWQGRPSHSFRRGEKGAIQRGPEVRHLVDVRGLLKRGTQETSKQKKQKIRVQ